MRRDDGGRSRLCRPRCGHLQRLNDERWGGELVRNAWRGLNGWLRLLDGQWGEQLVGNARSPLLCRLQYRFQLHCMK